MIAYAKGGVKPFVNSEFDLNKVKGKETTEKLYYIINELLPPLTKEGREDLNHPCPSFPKRADLNQYTLENWKKRLKAMMPNKAKKVLLISDFVSRIGGIETYVTDTKEIMEDMGYEVRLYGAPLSK